MAEKPTPTIGYSDQRQRLDAALQTGVKFSLIEGIWGSGKTKILREAMEKHPGIRIVEGSTLALTNVIDEELVKSGVLNDLYRRFLNKKTDPFAFLEKYDKPIVLYFDENRLVAQTILQIKNLVTDNPNLKAVFALTPEQKLHLFTEYPEVARRFNPAGHIMLDGLKPEERLQFFEEYSTMPFSEEAKMYVVEKKYPQEIIDRIEQLEVSAKVNKMDRVESTLIQENAYTEPVRVLSKSLTETTDDHLQPMERQILNIVKEHALSGGITPKEIAEKLGKESGTIRVRLVELRKKKLITSVGHKIILFQAENQIGIGP